MANLISFIMANKAAIALAVYALLDVIILLVPSLAGNGLVHQLMIWAKSLSGGAGSPPVPPAAS